MILGKCLAIGEKIAATVLGILVSVVVLLVFLMLLSMFGEILTGFDLIREVIRPYFQSMRG
jgi:hypothetical protein